MIISGSLRSVHVDTVFSHIKILDLSISGASQSSPSRVAVALSMKTHSLPLCLLGEFQSSPSHAAVALSIKTRCRCACRVTVW
jgi:hypothetical protein